MTARELRIGNIVAYKGDAVEINGISQSFNIDPFVVEIKFQDGMYSDVGIDDIKPIILTPDMLEDFGFVDCGGDTFNWYFKLKCIGRGLNDSDKYIILTTTPLSGTGDYKFRYSYNFSDFSNTCCREVGFNSVHHLQNLVYTLTDQDMNIKEFLNESRRSEKIKFGKCL